MMTDTTLTSKAIDDGELWSFLRSVLSQGGDIWLDHAARSYEQYSARLDAAARERVDALKALISPSHETGEHRANEWADMATNGIQWLRNIRDGVSTPAEALQEMESNLTRIQTLQHTPKAGEQR